MRSLLILIYLFLATTYAITLSEIQPIQGFPSQCTNGYNTPLQDCTSDELISHTCSTKCITFLEALTKIINEDCNGSSALPNTLLGLFFVSKGTATLCPNVLGSSGSDSQSSDAGSAASTSPIASPSSTTMSSTEVKTTSKTVSKTTVIATPTISSTVSAAATTTTGHIISASAATTSPTSQAGAQTSSTNVAASPTSKGRSGAGGTILDLGSSAPPNARLNAGMWMLLTFLLVAIGLR